MVLQFRNYLQENNVLATFYDSVEDFIDRLTHDLYKHILKDRLYTEKHGGLE